MAVDCARAAKTEFWRSRSCGGGGVGLGGSKKPTKHLPRSASKRALSRATPQTLFPSRGWALPGLDDVHAPRWLLAQDSSSEPQRRRKQSAPKEAGTSSHFPCRISLSFQYFGCLVKGTRCHSYTWPYSYHAASDPTVTFRVSALTAFELREGGFQGKWVGALLRSSQGWQARFQNESK